jgi:hypothetical protein
VSAVARLITYTGACAATLALRRARFDGQVQPATFVVPGGPLIPFLAIGSSMLILVMADRQQLLAGGAALVAGALLFGLNDRFGSGRMMSPVAAGLQTRGEASQ